MERRVLLSIFLSFLVLYLYQAYFVKPGPKPVAGRAQTAATATPSPGAGTPPAAPAAEEPQAAPAPASIAAATVVGETTERDIRVETQDVIAVFTNKGARLKSWRLKRYLDQQKHPQELVESLPPQPLPFSLRTEDAAVTSALNDSIYAVSGAPAAGQSSSAVDLRFEYSNSAGLHAVKTFHLDPSSYIMTFHATVAAGDRAITPSIDWGPGMADVGETSRYVQKPEGILFANGKVQRLAANAVAKQPTYDGQFKYAGVDDNYFMTTALFTPDIAIAFQHITLPPPPGTKAGRELMAYTITPRPGSPAQKFFIGPKDFDVLAAIDPDATKAINFGIFAVLVVPLLRSLKWVHGFVGNYGWSIIILTVIINAIMFPLRHKSVVSMRKMQEIQPEVKAIQDRYKNLKATDPAKQKMNQELMALYKERGVNPASGCVPMLLTLPVLYAMWALLQTSIELRGAPFMFWIHDLSAHDPYFVTPIFMGISQIWQQRLTPATGADPAQQKMMMFMPVFFTFIFLWLPAGLALYYAATNLWQIGQQYLTNYLIGPPKIRAVRPPAERRIKRAGGGKTEAAARES